jgi:hypothetical protein
MVARCAAEGIEITQSDLPRMRDCASVRARNVPWPAAPLPQPRMFDCEKDQRNI